MVKPRTEIVLQPGEFHFGDRNTRIRTLLGSCVAITLWHPKLLVGGMCHFLLPSRPLIPRSCDGRYGEEAMALLIAAIASHGTKPREYEAKLFGGGNMFPGKGKADAFDVGTRNADIAMQMLARHGIVPKATSLGQAGYRNVYFDVGTGNVWVRHVTELLQEVRRTA